VADTDTTVSLRAYFHAKRKELMALAEMSVCKHPGLIGGHREQIYRTYLEDLLPKRYSVGRGMVYDFMNKSRESDIVIWDGTTYPSLPLLDHSFFFAESVRGVIECKSSWSSTNFADVLGKCGAITSLKPSNEPNLADAVDSLRDQLMSHLYRRQFHGALLVKHQIGTAAMFLSGGQHISPKELLDGLEDWRIENEWPDLVLFLEAGLLIVKEKSEESTLKFYNFTDNVLLAFSISLLEILEDRVVHSEARFVMHRYAFQILDWEPFYVHPFKMTMLPAGRLVI